LIRIVVQTDDFDLGEELTLMRSQRQDIGAIVNFVGYVRDHNDGDVINTLTLEHYPEMTEKSLQGIVLQPADQIVMVAAASQHRAAAFEACSFVMDYLKTDAPFWKKEQTADGERWVESRQSDTLAKAQWDQP